MTPVPTVSFSNVPRPVTPSVGMVAIPVSIKFLALISSRVKSPTKFKSPPTVTIPAIETPPCGCSVIPVPTVTVPSASMSLSNVPIPETKTPLKNVDTPATCSVLAIDTLVGSKSPVRVSVDPSNVKLSLSSNSPPAPARTTFPFVKS